MQFHNYKTMKPDGHRGTSLDYLQSLMLTYGDAAWTAKTTMQACLEIGWLRQGRPFYNVHPIAVELCQKLSLNMKWGDLVFPTRYILLRFAGGHEPVGIKTSLLRVPSLVKPENKVEVHVARIKAAQAMQVIPLGGRIATKDKGEGFWVYGEDDIRNAVVEDSARAARSSEKDGEDFYDWAWEDDETIPFLIKLLAFIGLLARGTDLITPAILAADREEYDATSDESRKRWLEQRAASRQGCGFDIGRSLEIERATSPHWRSPHLALFHTGPGRTIPALKLRSGCVVIPKDMSQVPTGYLGPERELEEHKELPAVFRTSIPSKMRFHVFRRDGHRCRICGMTADDGVTLECDHIIAVANGGKTEIPNLWTLCRPCNNGKSDSDLHLALEENKAMEKARKEVKRGIRV
jgi:hypothetical protein